MRLFHTLPFLVVPLWLVLHSRSCLVWCCSLFVPSGWCSSHSLLFFGCCFCFFVGGAAFLPSFCGVASFHFLGVLLPLSILNQTRVKSSEVNESNVVLFFIFHLPSVSGGQGRWTRSVTNLTPYMSPWQFWPKWEMGRPPHLQKAGGARTSRSRPRTFKRPGAGVAIRAPATQTLPPVAGEGVLAMQAKKTCSNPSQVSGSPCCSQRESM